MNRDSFVFFKSFYEAIKNLPSEDQLDLYNAICEYSFNETIPETLSGIAKAMFILMKPNIDNANSRYKASVENGKKGGRPKKKDNLEKPNNNLEETKQEPNKNLNVDVDVDYNVDVDEDVDENEDYNVDVNSIANANDSVSKYQIEEDFSTLWSMYPRKQGKANALKYYVKAVTRKEKPATFIQVKTGIENYIKYIEIEKVQSKYIKQGSSWFNQECWNDDYSIKRVMTTKDLTEVGALDFSKFR